MTARPLALLLALPLAAACGGGTDEATYEVDATKACLERAPGVIATRVPIGSLAGIKSADAGLSVSWSLAKETPPAAALVLFATSVEEERHVEDSVDEFAKRYAGVPAKGALERRRNVTWMWVAPHRDVEARALRDCLDESLSN